MKIIIIGGGIGGFTAALALSKLAEVHLYEKAPDFKPLGTGIGIGSNALEALMGLGIAEDVLTYGTPLTTQLFLNKDGKILNSIDFKKIKNKFGQENITIHRGKLHEILYHHIPKEWISFNKRLVEVDQDEHQVTATFDDGEKVQADLLIAADGIHSLIRKKFIPDSILRYAGYTCWRGITENNGLIDEQTSYEIWGSEGRVGFAPMNGNQLYWFACMKATEKSHFFATLTQREVSYHFRKFPPNVAEMIQQTKDEHFLHHDIYDLKPVSRFVFDRVVLLGDAAHATTPNMGQGAGQAIEDAVTLANALRHFDLEDALQEYEEERVDHTKKVIQVSRQIGWASQWSNPLLANGRNAVLPFIPSALLNWRLKFLFQRKLNS